MPIRFSMGFLSLNLVFSYILHLYYITTVGTLHHQSTVSHHSVPALHGHMFAPHLLQGTGTVLS